MASLLAFRNKLSFAKGDAAMPVKAPKPPTEPLLAPWKGPYGGVPPFDQREVLVDTLTHLWVSALYGRTPHDPGN